MPIKREREIVASSQYFFFVEFVVQGCRYATLPIANVIGLASLMSPIIYQQGHPFGQCIFMGY